jgi:HlyD family secretion protein
MSKRARRVLLAIVGIGALLIAGWILSRPELPQGFASGNGRLEAKEIDVSAKYAGRIEEVLVDEGDTVRAGQIVATIDTEPLEAQWREAQAQIVEAEENRSTLLAEVTVKRAELDYAIKDYQRSASLVSRGAVSVQERDIDRARLDAARAALAGAEAQAVRANSTIQAATAAAERLDADIRDNTLKVPVRSRIQSRMAEPGEVLGAGGKVLSLVDLSDVYMYVFLPADVAGRVALGSEARIILDALPDFPIQAVVSYVSPEAQFTPKTVETAEERHDLSFRVKLQLDKKRLQAYEPFVKVGIPGMGYVRLDEKAEWPAMLQSRPLAELPWQATGAVERDEQRSE